MNRRGGRGELLHVEGSMEADKYVYPPGVLGSEAAKALAEGKLTGIRCGEKLIVPPRPYCPDHSKGELVEVRGPWIVESFTIVYEDMYGNMLETPQVIAVLRHEDAEGSIVHFLKAEKPRVGMRTRPVFKSQEERNGTLGDILYFEPAEQASKK